MAIPLQLLSYEDNRMSDTTTVTDTILRGPSPNYQSMSPTGKLPIRTISNDQRDLSSPEPQSASTSSDSEDDISSTATTHAHDVAPSIPDEKVYVPPIPDEKVYVETSTVPTHFPTHPLPEMQGSFEESMLDAGKTEESSNYRETNPDKFKGRSRRSLILSTRGGSGNVSYNAQWSSDPDAKHHPLMKIMSQVIFGVHLLCQSMAQSVPEVSSILSGFVQEIDSFLERVNGDYDMSVKDVSELHKNLSLPLQHVNVFDNLLSDRKYRTQTLEGNIRIDSLIKAYSQMMNDYQVDLQKLQEANLIFSTYLARIGEDWTHDSKEQWDIYVAMRRNTGIWNSNVKIIQDKSLKLEKMLQRCALCVNEFEKRCAAAARRAMSRGSSRSSLSSNSQNSSPTSRRDPKARDPKTRRDSHARQSRNPESRKDPNSRRVSSTRVEKPLPALPSKAETAISTPSTPLRQVMNADSTPARSTSTMIRPKPYKNTGLGKLQPRDRQRAESTAELAAFFRSVPPPNEYTEVLPPSQALEGRQFGSGHNFVKPKKSKATSLNDAKPFSVTSSRPSTAPSKTPKHIPLWTLMEKSPDASPSASPPAKPSGRHDSAVASGRQSRQSDPKLRSTTSQSRLRFTFRNPFKR